MLDNITHTGSFGEKNEKLSNVTNKLLNENVLSLVRKVQPNSLVNTNLTIHNSPNFFLESLTLPCALFLKLRQHIIISFD